MQFPWRLLKGMQVTVISTSVLLLSDKIQFFVFIFSMGKLGNPWCFTGIRNDVVCARSTYLVVLATKIEHSALCLVMPLYYF